MASFFPIFQKFFEIFQIFTISIETEAKGTILYLLYRKIVNKSIVSKECKKRSGIQIIADSDTASSESIKRLILSNRFKVGFGITVQYEIGIGNRVIVDEIVKF